MNTLFYLFCASTILTMLHSMLAYFLWDVPSYILAIPTILFGGTYLRLSGTYHINLKFIYGGLLIILAQLWGAQTLSAQLTIPLLPIFIVAMLSDEDKTRLFNTWCWVLGIILSVSLVAYFLIPTGIISSDGVITRPGFENTDIYTYINYRFCLLSVSVYIYRFHSIFCEPGHVAMISSFTLFLQGYKLKETKFWLILIPCVFTFSLAGYLLFAIGFFLRSLQKLSLFDIAKKLLPFAAGIIVIVFLGKLYNNGNNAFNEMILERLEYDEEKGISGNNRFSQITDDYFLDRIEDGSILWGLGLSQFTKEKEHYKIEGAGYKMFLMPYGIIGSLLVFLGYFYFATGSENRKIPLQLFIIFILAFLQRAYPFWASWIILLALSPAFYEEDCDNEELDYWDEEECEHEEDYQLIEG